MGINLHNAIVVVDEAHNLVDAVGSAHSASVTRVQLQTSQSQLAAYLAYFRQRLSASELHLHSPFLGSKVVPISLYAFGWMLSRPSGIHQ